MNNMKKKLASVMAFVLIVALLVPLTAFARPMDTVDHRDVDDTVFVPLRAAAYAHGWEVHWQRPYITLVSPVGFPETFVLNELVAMLGGFVERGTTWIPMEVAASIFESIQLLFTLTEQARDIALYDFDYMVEFVMANTPWDSVMRRIWGVGFLEIAASVRMWIEFMEPLPITLFDAEVYEVFRSQVPLHDGGTPEELAASYLFMLLAMVLAPELDGIGHLGPRSLDLYTAQVIQFERELHRIAAEIEGGTHYAIDLMLETAFRHPRAEWFYGYVVVDFEDEDSPLPRIPGNVTTALVSEDIAYIHIESFLADYDYDDEVILPFLQEIADFEHLIIDVRGNLGGVMSYPIRRIFSRLINEPVEFATHEFFVGGEAASAMMLALQQTAESPVSEIVGIGEHIYADFFYADEFIDERGMVLGDAAVLDYVMVSRSLISPADDAVGFEGKIWFLVDGWSASATALLAEMFMYTGLATVVGENTSRIMGSSHVYVALPNTGIIWRADIGYRTDAYGNSLEVFGIAPDIRNFPGMDAFDTVMTLIMGQDALTSW